MIGTLFVPLMVLVATALAIATKWGEPSIYNSGPQGFAETLYAYVSQGNNNGSAFAGYTGFVQPDGPTPARSASRSPTCSAASRCSAAASSRCSPCSRSRARWPASGSPRRPRDPANRYPDVRGRADRRCVIVASLTFVPALLLGPVSRASPTGSSEMRELKHRRARPGRLHASSSASPTRSSMTGVGAGRLAGQGRRRSARSSARASPRPHATSSRARRRRATPPTRPSSTTRGRTSATSPISYGIRGGVPAARGPVTPGLDARGCRRTP